MKNETRWHPIVEAFEQPVGVWTIHYRVGQQREPYLVVRLIRRGEEVGYRVDAHPTGAVIGYYKTLLAAAERGHQIWIATRAYGSAPNAARKASPWDVS